MGFVLINLLLCLFVCFLSFVVFCKSLFVICPLSFPIVSTFRGCVFPFYIYFVCTKQKSDYTFDMKYPNFFQDFTKFSCCILKVRWLFPIQMFRTTNALQFLLSGEDIKCSIFYTDVFIMYINHSRGHHDHDRDGMIIGFTTTCAISALAQPTLCFRIMFMARCIRYNIK